jgi:hypothetical protein
MPSARLQSNGLSLAKGASRMFGWNRTHLELQPVHRAQGTGCLERNQPAASCHSTQLFRRWPETTCRDRIRSCTTIVSSKIFCLDGKTLGSRNILLAVHKTDHQGIMGLHWYQSETLVVYTFDGNVGLMRVKLDVPQQMIRD